MSDAQTRMQRLLEKLIAEGRERGLQVTAYRHGKMVVDAFAGVADPATGRKVSGETVFPVFSVSKGIAATLVHMLAERGKLDYDAPMAHLWPEYAAHGKDKVTLRHALTHTAGQPYMPMGITWGDLGDWDKMCRLLAEAKPVTLAGEQFMYHAMTYGWLVCEPARRAMGKSVPQLLEEEICRPLGIKGLYMGVPEGLSPEVAVLEEVFEAGKEPSEADDVPKDVPGWWQPMYASMNRRDCQQACMPAAGGMASARALARMYAGLLPGGVDGVQLMSQKRVAMATVGQVSDLMGLKEPPRNFALGYFLGTAGITEIGDRITAFGHGGYGGSIGFADPEYGLAVGFTKNLFSAGNAQRVVLSAVREALGVPH